MTDSPPPGYVGGSILPTPTHEVPIERVQGGGGRPRPEGYSSASLLPTPVVRRPIEKMVGGGVEDYNTYTSTPYYSKLQRNIENYNIQENINSNIIVLFILDSNNKLFIYNRKREKDSKSTLTPPLLQLGQGSVIADTKKRETEIKRYVAEQFGIQIPLETPLLPIYSEIEVLQDLTGKEEEGKEQQGKEQEQEKTRTDYYLYKFDKPASEIPMKTPSEFGAGSDAENLNFNSLSLNSKEGFVIKGSDQTPAAWISINSILEKSGLSNIILNRDIIEVIKLINAILTITKPDELNTKLNSIVRLDNPVELPGELPEELPGEFPTELKELTFRGKKGIDIIKGGITSENTSAIRLVVTNPSNSSEPYPGFFELEYDGLAEDSIPPNYKLVDSFGSPIYTYYFGINKNKDKDKAQFFLAIASTEPLNIPTNVDGTKEIIQIYKPKYTLNQTELLSKKDTKASTSTSVTSASSAESKKLSFQGKKELESSWGAGESTEDIVFITDYIGKTTLVGNTYLVRDPEQKGVLEDIAQLKFTPFEFALFISLGFNNRFIKNYLKTVLKSTDEKDLSLHPFAQFWKQYVSADCMHIDHYYRNVDCIGTTTFLQRLYDDYRDFLRKQQLYFLLRGKEYPELAEHILTAGAISALSKQPVQQNEKKVEEQRAILAAEKGYTGEENGDAKDQDKGKGSEEFKSPAEEKASDRRNAEVNRLVDEHDPLGITKSESMKKELLDIFQIQDSTTDDPTAKAKRVDFEQKIIETIKEVYKVVAIPRISPPKPSVEATVRTRGAAKFNETSKKTVKELLNEEDTKNTILDAIFAEIFSRENFSGTKLAGPVNNTLRNIYFEKKGNKYYKDSNIIDLKGRIKQYNELLPLIKEKIWTFIEKHFTPKLEEERKKNLKGVSPLGPAATAAGKAASVVSSKGP